VEVGEHENKKIKKETLTLLVRKVNTMAQNTM
jgi:hypothetical protein